MSQEKSISELMKQGMDAARDGDKAAARTIFQEIVDRDEQNERAWMWLYSVVESDEERRLCLGNVLLINPNNEKAQAAMKRLDEKARLVETQKEEVAPGISRKLVTYIALGALAVVVVVAAILVLLNSSRNAEIAAATAVAVNATETTSALIAFQATEAANATATQVALASPTPSPTATLSRPTLPPEQAVTTPTPTLLPTLAPLPYPPDVTGRIAGWSGPDRTQIDFLPVVIFNLAANASAITLSDVEAANVDVSADGQRVIYTRYFQGTTYDTGLEQISTNGQNVSVITQGQNDILRSQMPGYCATQNTVVFVALPRENNLGITATVFPYQVYSINLDTNQLFRLTNDQLSYTYPVFSPDCQQVAVIRSELTGINQGSDLVLIDMTNLSQTALTSDLGAFTESAVRWSPDGSQLAYSAYPATDPRNGDIIIRRADPASSPTVLLRETADERYPVFSPDGRYVAFSSNRTGVYDLYVVNLESNAVYQLTSTFDEDYPGAWVP